MLESLSFYEVISNFTDCKHIETDILGEALREKDFNISATVYWFSTIPFSNDEMSFHEIYKYMDILANQLCDVYEIDKKYTKLILYGIFPKNYNPESNDGWNLIYQELEEIEKLDIEKEGELWYIKQLVLYYLINLYSKNVQYYYKVKPLLNKIKEDNEIYKKWIAEMAINF